MSLTPQQRAAVIAEAKTWIKTPWHHMGRIKGAGVDCGMFILECFERPGIIPHVVPPEYPPDWNMHRSEERYLAFIERFCQQVESPQPADLVAFKIGRCVSHAAIVIEWPVIIHSCLGHGVIMDDAVANTWFADRTAGFYAFAGDRDGR